VLGGIGTEAREGVNGDGEGGDPESELSSEMFGFPRAFAGTDLDKNLGMGRADGAGDALKLAPA
jgi:hypothetical protein